MRGGGLVVEGGAGLHPHLVADDLELAGRIGAQRIGEGGAGIGVGGAERGDDGAGRGVLLHGAAGDRDVGRGLVLVGDGDVDRLGAGEAAGVGDRHIDLVRGGGLVVEAGAGLYPDLVADDLELAGRVGAQRIGEGRAGIRVGRAQRGDDGPGRGVLLHRAAGDGDVGRGLVLVGDGDVDRLGAGQAAGVGDGDVDLCEVAVS